MLFRSDGIVRLQGAIQEIGTTKIGESWDGTEHIGVYMLEESQDFEVAEEIVNKKYKVSPIDGNRLSAIDEEAVYPTDGRRVKFIAYYPYAENIVNNIYKVNLKNNAVSDHDLLYAESNGYFDKAQTEAVQLEF